MEKVTNRKIQGISWLTKAGLILLLMFFTSAFMGQGWYNPNQAAAAFKTLYIDDDSGTTVATGVTTNTIDGTRLDSGNPNPDINLMATTTAGTNSNRTTGSYADGVTMFESIYNTAYASGATVTGTSYFGRLRDGDAGGITYGFRLFYVTADGTKTDFSGAQSTQVIPSGSSADYTVSLATQSASVPAGAKIGIRLIHVTSSSNNVRVYYGNNAAVSGGDGGVVIVNEVFGDTLTATANTAIAPSPQLANATGVLMQRFQVAASANTIVLNSLTLDDLGTATGTVADARIYIDTTSSITLPGTAVLVGNTGTGWTGTSTAITLNQGTAADRTVTSGTLKYIYIVYDLDNTQATKTIQSSVTALGVVSPNTVAGFAAMNSTAITLNASPTDTLTVGTNTPIALAAMDSDYGVVMQRLKLDSNASGNSEVVLVSITLDDNLTTATNYDNAKIYIDTVSSTTLPGTAVLIGSKSSYTGDSTVIALNQGVTADRTVVFGTSKYLYVIYDMTYTQSPNTVQSRVTAVGVVTPDVGATGLTYASNSFALSPGIKLVVTSCNDCHFMPIIQDGTARNVPLGRFQGSHEKHAASGTSKYAYDCTKCHVSNTAFYHADGNIEMANPINADTGATYAKGTSFAVSNAVFSGQTCSNNYCHSNATGNTSQLGDTRGIVANTSPAWGGSTTCTTCHGKPPAYANYTGVIVSGSKANAHQGGTHLAQTCDVCHTSVATSDGGATYTTYTSHNNGKYSLKASLGYSFDPKVGGTCATPGCHSSASWGQKIGCIDCHNTTVTRTLGRPGTTLAAVTTEFGLAWGHKKSGRATVSDADCIVCHLEGVYATGKASATYHMNGDIDLRDPDGAGETPITNISGGAFTFQRFSTSFAAGSRVANGETSNTIANVITQKFCVACHDSNGASNPTARSDNGGTGTASMPFGGIALGSNYTALNNAIGTQGLVNVATQFALTNSSRHPVLGSLTRDFPYSTRLATPYNNIGTARNSNGTSGHTTAASVVINCFDCHNVPTTPITIRTIVAHGNAQTLRGTIYAFGAVSTLCSTCHTGYTTSSNHSTGSAWAQTGSKHNVSRDCQDCHGTYQTNSSKPARPIPAQDYHGSNALNGGGLWPTVNSRPYAFIRAWGGNAYHRPYRASEFTSGSAACGGGNCPSGGSGGQVGDSGNGSRTYSAGGTY